MPEYCIHVPAWASCLAIHDQPKRVKRGVQACLQQAELAVAQYMGTPSTPHPTIKLIAAHAHTLRLKGCMSCVTVHQELIALPSDAQMFACMSILPTQSKVKDKKPGGPLPHLTNICSLFGCGLLQPEIGIPMDRPAAARGCNPCQAAVTAADR